MEGILKQEPWPVFMFPGHLICHLSPLPHFLALLPLFTASVLNCVLFLDLYFTLFFTPLLTNRIVHGPVSDLIHPSKDDAQHHPSTESWAVTPSPMQALPLTMLPYTTSSTRHFTQSPNSMFHYSAPRAHQRHADCPHTLLTAPIYSLPGHTSGTQRRSE